MHHSSAPTSRQATDIEWNIYMNCIDYRDVYLDEAICPMCAEKLHHLPQLDGASLGCRSPKHTGTVFAAFTDNDVDINHHSMIKGMWINDEKSGNQIHIMLKLNGIFLSNVNDATISLTRMKKLASSAEAVNAFTLRSYSAKELEKLLLLR